MPTAILDVDVENIPHSVRSFPDNRYRGALILLRLRGVPVSQVWHPIVDGRLDLASLREEIWEVIGTSAWQKVFRDELTRGAGPGGLTCSDATVAVCTRDRPQALERCLTALTRLEPSANELLVIDNCPSDNQTQRVAAQFAGVRYVREEQPGLNRARNRALREALGSVVVFADDDTTPDSGWLRALMSNFDHPRVMCATGLTMPLELETEAQELFEQHSTMARGFQRVVYDSTILSPALAGLVGVGANMAVRRCLIDDIGPFDEALDAGTATRSGGDNEYFTRILTAGYRIVYDPAALSWHRHRASRAEVRQVFSGYGLGVYAAWTRGLVVEHELTVARAALAWLWHVQLPGLVRSLFRRPGAVPLDLALAQLSGCARGPFVYLLSRRSLQPSRTVRLT